MNFLAASTIRYIQAHWSEPVTTRGLAALLAVPQARLITHCKIATGTTPYQMLLDTRMAHAKTLLRTTVRTCADIAEEVGFGDPSQFGTAFRRKVGLSPERYRQAMSEVAPDERLAVVTALWGQVDETTQSRIVTMVETQAKGKGGR